MLKRIKDINEALPGMLLIECIYLVVVQWDCLRDVYMLYSVHFI